MDALFDAVLMFYSGSFFLALILCAVLSLAAAIGLLWHLSWRNEAAVPVSVRVEALHEEPGKDGTIMYRPEFVVTAGAYKRQRYKSEVAANPATYEMGEECHGFYQPKTGVILTTKTIKGLRIAAAITAVVGVGAMVGAVYLGAQLGR